MPQSHIPERDPIGDPFHGVLIKIAQYFLLTYEAPQGFEVCATGDFVIRYGIRYLGKPQLSIVPGLVALDYGDMLTGEEALEFLMKKSNLHPRADVLGYRNDGRDDMIAVKHLDMALPMEVLVFRDEHATIPLASIDALIVPETAQIPQHLKGNLRCYRTIQEWLTRNG